MQAIELQQPGGLDKLNVVDVAAPGEPGPGEIKVRLHASSLNFHDYAVVAGMIPTDDKRIPMSDGAGVVEAVGEGVEEFAVGDAVAFLIISRASATLAQPLQNHFIMYWRDVITLQSLLR